jgi:hypothetical protein
MDLLVTLLIVLAVVLCVLAGFRIGTPRVHLGWLGVAAALLAWLLGNLHV